MQRRMMTPIFTVRRVRSLAPAMAHVIDELVNRWRCRDGQIIDVADEVTNLALRMLARTIFSDGIGGNIHDLHKAMRIYFDSLGRIDPSICSICQLSFHGLAVWAHAEQSGCCTTLWVQ